MKIVILSSTAYKEKDLIYNAVSKTEAFSFKAKGGAVNESKYRWLNNPLTVADVELTTDGRYKHPIMKEAKIISSPISGNDSSDYLFAMNTINDVVNNMFQEDERYLLFQDLIDAVDAIRNHKDVFMVMLIFLAKAMKLAGMELEVNKCVFCGATKDIVAFSFPDGGFVCRNCADESIPTDLSTKQMLLVRYAFRAKDYSCPDSDKFSKEDKKVLLEHFKAYIHDDLGVNLLSINYLVG